jgi:hypothetical protein
MAITPDVIADYIANILGGSGTDAEKAATINAAAEEFGVSREDINAATGYGMDVINAYLGPLSYAGSADDRQQDAIDAATVQPAEYYSPLADASRIEPADDPVTSYQSYTPVVDNTYNTSDNGPVDYGGQGSYVAPADTSSAYDYATSTGGIGVNQMDQNIRDFFANNPSEFDTVAAMVKYGVSEADIQRATGKTLSEIYAPPVAGALSSVTADTLSGAVGNDTVTGALASVDDRQQAAVDAATVKPAETTYRGVDIPSFSDRYVFTGGGEDPGIFQSASEQLENWKAEQDRLATLTPAQRAIQNAARTESQENALVTTYDPITLGGKEWTVTAGGNSLMRLADDQSGLGPKQYRYEELDAATGQIRQGVDVEGPGLFQKFLTNPITGIALGLLLPGVGQAIGSALGATGAAAGALGSGVLNFGLQVAAGADPVDALKGAVLSAGAGFVGTQVGSMLPAELASAGKNAVTQLITTGKLDPAALATSVGSSFATDALAAETGMDKATASKLVTAGIQAISGNELAALTSLAQAGLQSGLAGTGTTASSSQNRAAFLEANASPLGLSALSPNPSEDELISLEQRTNAANQLLRDYTSLNSDLSREGAVNQLTALGINATKANELISNADSQVEQRRVATDVMSRYSRIDPEFGTPQLDRNTAVQEMVASGVSIDRANELLNGIDAQNAIKLENKLSVQSAYQNFVKGTGSEEALRSAMTSAGYTDADINNQVTRGRAIVEGSKLTAGETAQQRAELLRDIRAEAANKSTFGEAYALVRDKLGPGATFTWQGKEYVASSAAERPDLVSTTTGATAGATTSTATTGATADLGTPYVAPNGMHNRAAFIAAGGGTSDADYAKYVNAVNSVISQGQSGTLIKPSSVNSTGKELPATTGAVTTGKPSIEFSTLFSNVSDALSKQMQISSAAAQEYLKNNPNSPFTQSVSTAYDAAGELIKNVGGGTALLANNKPLADAFIKGGDELQKMGQSIGTGPQDTANFNTTMQLLDSAKGIQEKLSVLAGRVLDGTSGLARQTVIELRQELPALFLGGAGAKAALIASGLIDTGDTAGGAAIDAYDSAVKSGKTHQDALTDARKAGAAAGATEAAIQLTIGKLGELAVGKLDDVAAKAIGRVGGETVTEGAQEGLASAAVDLALTGNVDVNKALTQGIIGGAIGKTTSLATTPVSTAQDISESINASVTSGSNLATATNNVVASSLTGAINSGQDINTAASTIVVGALNAGSDPATVVNSVMDAGIKSGVDTSSLASATTISALNGGADTATVVSSVISSGATKGDVSGLVSSTVTSALSTGADASTVVSSAVKSGVTSGGNTSTVITSAVNSGLNNGVDAATVVTAAVDGGLTSKLDAGSVVSATVTSALNNGADASTVISSAVTAAVGGSQLSTETATVSAVSSAVTAGVKSGVDTATVVNAAVSAAVTNSGGNQEVIASSLQTSVAAATTAGGNVSTVVSSAVNTAVNNGVNSTTAAASAVAGVIATGGNVNAAVEAARTSSGVQIATSVQGSRTIVTATDGNTVTKTVVDTTNNVTVTSVTDLSTNQTISTVTDTQTQQDITALQQTATQIKTDLTTQINTLAKTNSDADKIIKDSIQKVADDLGISKTELLDKIGATETSLKAELSNELAQVSQNLNKQIKGLKTGLGTSAALAAAQPIRGISLDNDWLKGQMLKAGKAEGYRDPLAEFQALQEEAQREEMIRKLQPELADVLTERGAMPYYAYGQELSIDEALGLPSEDSSGYNNEPEYEPVFKSGGKVSPLNLQMMYAKGGHTREDFRHGKHVAGPGDGQSDDIPAWLADGEFVFPADVVSALGNGSTKAGTEKLYEMMHSIRDRARSKGPKDLPPPAHKSPLDYLKSRK